MTRMTQIVPLARKESEMIRPKGIRVIRVICGKNYLLIKHDDQTIYNDLDTMAGSFRASRGDRHAHTPFLHRVLSHLHGLYGRGFA